MERGGTFFFASNIKVEYIIKARRHRAWVGVLGLGVLELGRGEGLEELLIGAYLEGGFSPRPMFIKGRTSNG